MRDPFCHNEYFFNNSGTFKGNYLFQLLAPLSVNATGKVNAVHRHMYNETRRRARQNKNENLETAGGLRQHRLTSDVKNLIFVMVAVTGWLEMMNFPPRHEMQC